MNKNSDIKISELPENVSEDGVKVYGETSYETQVAILSQFLHSLDSRHDIMYRKSNYYGEN